MNDCSYTVEKVLCEWGVVLDAISKFHSELASLGMSKTVDGVIYAAGGVYSETRKFVGSVITTYMDKHLVRLTLR